MPRGPKLLTPLDLGAYFAGTPAVDNLEQNLNVGGDIEEASARQETAVFEKYNALLHGGITTTTGKGANKRKEVLSVGFVKKYIQYAKSKVQPGLTQGAAEHITATYTALRNDDLQLNQKRVRFPKTIFALTDVWKPN